MKAIIIAACAAVAMSACNSKPQLELRLSDKFEGQEVQMVNFLDSTVMSTAVVENGKAEFRLDKVEPVFTAIMIDGRTRAFYISEPGKAYVNDSTNAASGTPLNDRFGVLLAQLDSIEDLDDLPPYIEYARKAYEDTKETPMGSYFGIEWVRYAPASQIDSILGEATFALRTSPKALRYREMAELRDRTAPGKEYVDFYGENEKGKRVKLSQYLNKGGYTLVDFWASWCPYCIKEIPELKALQDKWGAKGLRIVGVAVRDTPSDTKSAIAKHGIEWEVVYNTQRRPYDIYGITGIPHHILIAPDGTIVSRGENASQIDARMETLLFEDADK